MAHSGTVSRRFAKVSFFLVECNIFMNNNMSKNVQSCSPPDNLRKIKGTQGAASHDMAFVLISWLSISMLFCLALVRAAARKYVQGEAAPEAPAPLPDRQRSVVVTSRSAAATTLTVS